MSKFIQRLPQLTLVPLMQHVRDITIGHNQVERLDDAARDRLPVLECDLILRLAGGIFLPAVFLDVAAAFLEIPFLLLTLPDDLGIDRSNQRERDDRALRRVPGTQRR